ncbi:hypothetical protein [Sporosarcina obsidiansis]|uniref:hypothetical protein n=1 Tax=Sporosarcina obsidiansis TaxID=2660748 RepID=UPI00129ADCCE|nr:hypothetical protein [Sporosarcina obsidiansis]
MKFRSLRVAVLFVVLTLVGCQQSELVEEKPGTPIEEDVASRVEVVEDDFIYRLISEKEQYHESQPINIYAELEYTGEKEEVEISHAASPFYFPIRETTREYVIEYSMDTPLEHTTLKKGVPLRADYETSGSFLEDDTDEYKAFIRRVMNGSFSTGRYVVNGYAEFTVDGEEVLRKIEANVGFSVKGDIAKVSISKSNSFGQVNEEFFAVTEEEGTLKTLQNTILNAVKQPGIVDMVASDYDMEVVYDDGSTQGYHLWLGEKGQKSTLMQVDDTHTIYTVSEEMTDPLRRIVNH